MSSATLMPRTQPSLMAGIGSCSPALRGLLLAALVAFGSLALYPVWTDAFRLWATDPLRSIGAAFPVVAYVGVLALLAPGSLGSLVRSLSRVRRVHHA